VFLQEGSRYLPDEFFVEEPMISAGAMERVRLSLISGSPSGVWPRGSWIVVAFVWGWSEHFASNVGIDTRAKASLESLLDAPILTGMKR